MILEHEKARDFPGSIEVTGGVDKPETMEPMAVQKLAAGVIVNLL
jgi:hypothetical protein